MHRSTSSCALAAGVALLLLPGCLRAQSSAGDQQSAPEVKKLVISGVQNIDPTLLEASIATQASSCKSLLLEPFCLFTNSPTFVDRHYLDRTELERDMLRIRVFYWERGYRATEVDTSVTPNGSGVTVEFAVTENKPTVISRIRIEYDSTVLTDRQRERLTGLHAGDPLDLIALDSMRLAFRNAMWEEGYADAVVDTAVTVNAPAQTATVLLRITPNALTIVGDIVITGAEEVSTRTILDALTLRRGEVFRRSQLLISQRSLYESNLFRQARISVPEGQDSVKTVEVTVAEAPLHEARTSVGFSNVDFFQVEGRFTHYNIFGGARRLDVTGTVGNLLAQQLNGAGFFRDVVGDVTVDPDKYLQPTWDASIEFTQPSFLRRPNNSLALGAFGHRKSAPGIFIDRGYGVSGTFTRNIQLRAPASLNYRYEVTRLEAGDVYFCVNFGVCDSPTIASMRSHQTLSPLSLTGFIDRTDQPFSPTEGYMARVDIEHASSVTLSDYRYNRGFVDAAAYTHFRTPRYVLAGHLRLGLVRALARGAAGVSVLHPRKRFYAGGSQSVRGYGENQLGPRVLTVDPGTLRGDSVLTSGDTVATLCPASVPITNCNPNDAALSDADFRAQPLGGTSLIEASVEFRFPLFSKLDGAVFVDGAVVGEAALRSLGDIGGIVSGTGAITPGFGVRYRSPVGPIRVDVGINPRLSEDLDVFTSVEENGVKRIERVGAKRTYTTGGARLLDRFVLHLSIGQAF